MEREYIEIVLKRTGKKVKMKAYLTVKESRELNKSIMGIDFDKKGFDEVVLFEGLLFGAFVVSIDEKEENLFDSMGDFPESDYRQIIEEATKLKNDGNEKKLIAEEEKWIQQSEGSSEISDELFEVLAIRATGWTHEEFMNQPDWLVEAVIG